MSDGSEISHWSNEERTAFEMGRKIEKVLAICALMGVGDVLIECVRQNILLGVDEGYYTDEKKDMQDYWKRILGVK